MTLRNPPTRRRRNISGSLPHRRRRDARLSSLVHDRDSPPRMRPSLFHVFLAGVVCDAVAEHALVGMIDGPLRRDGLVAEASARSGVYLGLLGIIGSSLSLSWRCTCSPASACRSFLRRMTSRGVLDRQQTAPFHLLSLMILPGRTSGGVQRRHADAVSARAGGTRHDVTGRCARAGAGGEARRRRPSRVVVILYAIYA